MDKTLQLFEKVAKDIPRCSKQAHTFADFIETYAKERGFRVERDATGNLLCSQKKPKLCLQSHYDMVCVGDTEHLELVHENGFLRAKNSSLGADNGIGVCMMLSLMDDFDEVEYLFTADEEIGMIGAKNIGVRIASNAVLNLDSEEENALFVSCAGGSDLLFHKTYETMSMSGNFYEISLAGLPGGHSGLEIHKNIPNAIIELAKLLEEKNAYIASFFGGEKRNAIPSSARAVVCLQDENVPDGFTLQKCESQPVICESAALLKLLSHTPHGAGEIDFDLGVPEYSDNFALIHLQNGVIDIHLSLRAMSNRALDLINNDVREYFDADGFSCEELDRYSPWEWEMNDFAVFVKSYYKKYFINANFRAIHAGLECAILRDTFPNAQFVSLGPNILNPHSINESVEIDSVHKTYEAVFEIISQAVRKTDDTHMQ